MFDGIKNYQRANKLQVDGVMKPGGETEKSITAGLGPNVLNRGSKTIRPKANPPEILPPYVDPNMPVIQRLPKEIYADPYVDKDGNPIINGRNPKEDKMTRPYFRT